MGADFFAFIVLIAMFVELRNRLAHRWRWRMCHEARDLAYQSLDAEEANPSRFFDRVPSHVLLMCDLTRWNYRSPFADPVAEAQES